MVPSGLHLLVSGDVPSESCDLCKCKVFLSDIKLYLKTKTCCVDSFFLIISLYIAVVTKIQICQQDYKPDEDPSKFKSAKTGRGPLGHDWKVNSFLDIH